MQSTLVRCLQGPTSLDKASDKAIFAAFHLRWKTLQRSDGNVDEWELQTTKAWNLFRFGGGSELGDGKLYILAKSTTSR